MTPSDRARILATGPRNFEEAKFICDEFSRAAHECLTAPGLPELFAAMRRLAQSHRLLPDWIVYRNLELRRRELLAQPCVIRRNLSTQENREFWDGVDRAAIEVATWPEWKIDRPRATTGNGDGEPLDSAKQSDHNEGTD